MHDIYRRLGNDDSAPYYAYRALFSVDLSKDALHDIQGSITFSMPWGNENLIKQIEQAIACKFGYAKLGRPAKHDDSKQQI